jgi:hypothetical protein
VKRAGYPSGFGPSIGGLFLAFPALPASATLIEKHEKHKKEENGVEGRHPALIAADSAMGIVRTVTFRFDSLAIRAPLQDWDGAHAWRRSLADGFRADLTLPSPKPQVRG